MWESFALSLLSRAQLMFGLSKGFLASPKALELDAWKHKCEWPPRDTVTLHQEKSWWQQCPCEDGAGALLSRQAQSQERAMEGWMSQWKLRKFFKCCMARNEVREMRISLIIGELFIFKIKTPVDSVLSPLFLHRTRSFSGDSLGKPVQNHTHMARDPPANTF